DSGLPKGKFRTKSSSSSQSIGGTWRLVRGKLDGERPDRRAAGDDCPQTSLRRRSISAVNASVLRQVKMVRRPTPSVRAVAATLRPATSNRAAAHWRGGSNFCRWVIVGFVLHNSLPKRAGSRRTAPFRA